MPVLASIAIYARQASPPPPTASKEMAVQAEPPTSCSPEASEDGSPMPVAEHRFVAVEEAEAVAKPSEGLLELKELFAALRRLGFEG